MFIMRNLPDILMRYEADGTPQGGDDGNQASAPDNSQGQGGADNNNQQASQNQGRDESESGLAGLLARYNNDALKVAERLLKDNYEARERARKLQEQIDASQETWQAYQALGKPDEIAAKLRQGEIERVAGKAGYNAQVLSDLDRMAGGALTYEVRTEQVDGQPVERVYVKDGSDADAQPQLLDEFAAARWAAYLPALQPQQQASQGQPPSGTRFPRQHPGTNGTSAAPDLLAQFQQEQNEKAAAVKNPLLNN